MVKVGGMEVPLPQALAANLLVHRPPTPEPAGPAPGEQGDPPAKADDDDPDADQDDDPLAPLSDTEIADYEITANAVSERLAANGDDLADLLGNAWDTTVVSDDGSIELSPEITGKLDAALGAAKADEVAGAMFQFFEAHLATALNEAGVTAETGAAVVQRFAEHPEAKKSVIAMMRGQSGPITALLKGLAGAG